MSRLNTAESRLARLTSRNALPPNTTNCAGILGRLPLIGVIVFSGRSANHGDCKAPP